MASDVPEEVSDPTGTTHVKPIRTRQDMVAEDSNPDKTINPSDDNVNKIFEGWETRPAIVVDQDKIDHFFDYGQLGSAPYEAITNIRAEINRVLPGALRQDSRPLF